MQASRILFVSHSPVVSGAEAILLELVKPFPDASVFVFEPGPLQERLSSMGLNVIASRWGRGVARVKREGSLWKALPVLGRLVGITLEIVRAARRHDVIYANSQKAFVLSAIAARIARRPLIWHLHDIPSREHFGKAQLKLQIALANASADRVIVPSLAVKEGFIASGGKLELVRVVPNGVPVPLNDNLSRQDIRAGLGLPEAPLVGVFSRLAGWKGQHVLIEALASLPGVHGIIAGTALFGEEAYARQLEEQVARLNLQDRVRFLGHRSDVPTLMRGVDVVVHPSTAPEPFGLTLVESAFAGTPVVAAAAGAIPEILEDGRAGWLVPPGDAASLAEAIGAILAAPEEAARRSLYARERAMALYSADRMTGAVGRVIAEIPARRSA